MIKTQVFVTRGFVSAIVVCGLFSRLNRTSNHTQGVITTQSCEGVSWSS